MRIENAVGAEVLERMLSAYGFSMQKELAEHLGIAKSNVAGWVQRGQVPGNAIVQCALDTGADLNWLINGELEKANPVTFSKPDPVGKALYEEVMANGGKPVLRRILDAYGFTMQKQLCDLLDISSGTVSTWIRRNYFPGDVVITCALDTNVSLRWLATGKEKKFSMEGPLKYENCIVRKALNAGVIEYLSEWFLDLSFLPQQPLSPVFISSRVGSWVIDEKVTSISNGRWLLGINNKFDIYDVAVLPGNMIKIQNKNLNFDCSIDDIDIAGKVVVTIEYNL
ncbi:phage repressor protein CI [Duffyella gerundensis]|uniref:phage repressor protein CI n=1 Tax=Duffyella gerundensis TaxID=1619313 RepID=UPI00082D6C70|nr:phage repressor protein CI [Duffyella gerundensis]